MLIELADGGRQLTTAVYVCVTAFRIRAHHPLGGPERCLHHALSRRRILGNVAQTEQLVRAGNENPKLANLFSVVLLIGETLRQGR